VRDGDPMAGGLFTEIVQRVFENSDYTIVPRVLPWQRMKDELRSTNNWVGYGFQDGFEEGIPFELASPPIFPFNHVAATLAENELSIKTPEDVFGRTVILVENFHYPGLDSYLTNPTAGTGSGQIPSVRAFDPEGTLQMLKHRRGEVVFDWQVRLVYNLSAANLKPDEIRFQDASGIIPTKDMYFAYSPNWSKSFKEFVHRRLLALRADGTLDAILQKYGGTSDLIR
jgi:ABC-type amino acid transport substrate-binding protein